MAMTYFGSGICSYNRRTRLAILNVTVPATIIRSAWRGVARNAPAPKRSMSNRLAPAAIISMAQHARPNVIGQILACRAQFIDCSSVVVITFSSNRPSSHVMIFFSLALKSIDTVVHRYVFPALYRLLKNGDRHLAAA